MKNEPSGGAMNVRGRVQGQGLTAVNSRHGRAIERQSSVGVWEEENRTAHADGMIT